MNNTQLILLSIFAVAFFVFGIRYVSRLQKDLDFKKVPITCRIEPTETGYSASCKEIDGIIAVGSTILEVQEDFEESFMLWLNYTQGQYHGMWRSDFEITYVEV